MNIQNKLDLYLNETKRKFSDQLTATAYSEQEAEKILKYKAIKWNKKETGTLIGNIFWFDKKKLVAQWDKPMKLLLIYESDIKC